MKLLSIFKLLKGNYLKVGITSTTALAILAVIFSDEALELISLLVK